MESGSASCRPPWGRNRTRCSDSRAARDRARPRARRDRRRPARCACRSSRRLRHAVLDVVLEVGGDALQAADRNRCFLDAAAAACRLAWTIAGASQNSGKHIRFPIDHIGVAITPLGNQTDVFGNWRVSGAGPLAIDHFVKVVWRRDISRFHSYLVRASHGERGLILPANAQSSVLVVFELDHRVILLEPFQTRHKGNFARSPAFNCMDART